MSAQALRELTVALRSAAFQAHVMPLGNRVPEGYLLVYLGQDDRGHDFYVQLVFLQDLQQAVERGESSPATEEEEFDYLQFYVALPFQVDSGAFADLARLILALNWSIPLGGFGLNEEERQVYLREVMLCRDGRADPKMAVVTVESMLASLQEYAGVLEDVSTGVRSLEQVMGELEM